jgi:hypothetical protein
MKRCSRAEKPFGRRAVKVKALRLKVRAFIPSNAQPPEPVENPIDQIGTISLNVSVFDAKQQCAAIVAGEKPIEKSGPSASDMQITGWRWSKTDAGRLRSCHRELVPFRLRKSILAKTKGEIESARNSMKSKVLVPGYC